MLLHKLAVLLLTLFVAANAVAEITLTAAKGTSDDRKAYTNRLLTAALNANTAHNHFESVKQVSVSYGYDARAYLVSKGQADVTYFPAEKKIERHLIPIRVPLYKGLMGYRFLLIQAKDQTKFDSISNLQQLKRLLKGTGTRWRMTQVYQYHNFAHVKADTNHSLYKMLNVGRFDYTTRGVIEASETQRIIQKRFGNLAIENNILLYTELPIYFFVGADNPALAKRIESGLHSLIKTGKFDKIFAQFFATVPTDLALETRRVLYVENPFLSAESKHNAQTFWQQSSSPLPFTLE
ncbi:hypothetical protein DS2_15394 [Catenovulum agarivorans DS-2]|uniref:Uncharacterized protein n=1 Tax=Catenovulum agarivorans DS-2 TaxID=1328313 RepID=W7QA31_9ALTE|nr:transporter substrate-binding domain-containing protein [Catenovulum agarivorans]EWH08856.1 hypothetical protein DS2_15394 [Catenovulum agarivorans DS-2]